MARKNKRPKLENKVEVMRYIEENSDVELPFVEEVWKQAVEKCEENKKNVEYEIKVEYDEEGNVASKKKIAVKGSKNINPVSAYWRMMGLQQNKSKALALLTKQQKHLKNDDFDEIINDVFEENTEDYADEILTWIEMFGITERKYLKARYSHYYNQYEINDGADKSLLKRILSIEIELNRIDNKRARGQSVSYSTEEKLTKQYQGLLESQKWTKKQRSAMDDAAQNKFTLYMEKMIKEGRFSPNPKIYDKDEVDFTLDAILENQRKMLS